MEVYSIISDLDTTSLTHPFPLLSNALLRNQKLLRRYSNQFKKTTVSVYLRRMRLHLK
jgi:hypothetical protein